MAANLQNPPNPIACSCSISSLTQSMLLDSIKLFLSQYESGFKDFSHFKLMFSRMIHTMASPPIEVIWFYSAVNFHSLTLEETEDEWGRVSALNNLFHSLVSCSGSGPCSSSLKKVTVLAPLIYELYTLISDLRLCKIKMVTGIAVEIGCLLERLVSFISLCCCEPVVDDHTVASSPSFLGLLNVWMVQKRHGDSSINSLKELFFPILSDEIRSGLLVDGTATVGVLAGVVMCEAFLLYICFKCSSSFDLQSSQQLQNVTCLAVHTISAFRSCYFFDTILKMLLEPSLPVKSLLNVGDEARLREAMFDAIVLVDYPFLNPACGICLCSHHLNKLATTWLFVAAKAIQFLRHNGDQTKQISYMKAFFNSPILSQLFKWVSTQIAMVGANRTFSSTPAAFMYWLVQLTNQASSGFNDEFKVFCEKALNYLSEIKSTLLYLDELDNNLDVGQTEVDDNRVDHDLAMNDLADDTQAGCNGKFMTIGACRKRKEENDEGGLRVKLLKYQIHGSPIKMISPS